MKGKKLRIAGVVLLSLACLIALIFLIYNMVYYAGIEKNVYVELGDNLPDATAFLKDEGSIKYITDVSKIDETKEGKHQVKVDFNNKEKTVYIIIEDTVAPDVTVRDVDISIYEELEAKDLITEVKDNSKVKIEFQKEPDFGSVGKYEAVIRVSDEAGNVTKVTSIVNVLRVKEYVEYYYGDAYPTAKDFIYSDKDTGELVTDLESTIDKPGTYYVTVKIDEKNYKAKLIVMDKEAPLVVGKDAEITAEDIDAGIALTPKDFVVSYEDRDDVTMYFVDKPDYTNKKDLKVNVAVSDLSGNTTVIERTLYVVENKGFDVDYGSEFSDNVITAGLKCVEATLVSGSVDTSTLGRYEIVVNADGEEKTVAVNVVDTDVPKANPVPVTLESKQSITPSMFVSDISDLTKVTCTFEKEPDTVNRGVQNVRIVLTDEAGNRSYVDSTLNILYDAIAPVFEGTTDITTYIRMVPDYSLGVMAIDDVDGQITVTVDDSKVDYEVPGNYEATYEAVDLSGNVARVTIKVQVNKITREAVDSMVDGILAEITNDSMTITEKAKASYEYIQENVRYINQADQSSVEKAAYDGLTLGVGDCFTFASLVEVFVERIGGETVFVRRYNSSINHYWMLCNLGTGWYHMDATPRNSTFKCFMKTDAEINAESATYWTYDKSLYPAVATESYK